MYLTKTDFQEYLQCSKCLWLKKNNPDLYIRPSISEFDQKLIDEGYEVELAAREMFENGILVEGSNEQAALKTKELIQSKTSPIFQATFITSSGLLAKTDILIYNEFMNAWSIYEVKSSTSIKTGKDENHIYDITFQKLVLNQSDIPVDETYIIHMRKDFKKTSDLNLFDMFTITDVTELVEAEYNKVSQRPNKRLSLLQIQT